MRAACPGVELRTTNNALASAAYGVARSGEETSRPAPSPSTSTATYTPERQCAGTGSGYPAHGASGSPRSPTPGSPQSEQARWLGASCPGSHPELPCRTSCAPHR